MHSRVGQTKYMHSPVGHAPGWTQDVDDLKEELQNLNEYSRSVEALR